VLVCVIPALSSSKSWEFSHRRSKVQVEMGFAKNRTGKRRWRRSEGLLRNCAERRAMRRKASRREELLRHLISPPHSADWGPISDPLQPTIHSVHNWMLRLSQGKVAGWNCGS
jgi:hypothetical protein